MMALNQSVLRRAQGEVDKVIGSDRLPSFGDRGDLPYINALVKELLRWESVTPVGQYRYRLISPYGNFL